MASASPPGPCPGCVPDGFGLSESVAAGERHRMAFAASCGRWGQLRQPGAGRVRSCRVSGEVERASVWRIHRLSGVVGGAAENSWSAVALQFGRRRRPDGVTAGDAGSSHPNALRGARSSPGSPARRAQRWCWRSDRGGAAVDGRAVFPASRTTAVVGVAVDAQRTARNAHPGVVSVARGGRPGPEALPAAARGHRSAAAFGGLGAASAATGNPGGAAGYRSRRAQSGGWGVGHTTATAAPCRGARTPAGTRRPLGVRQAARGSRRDAGRRGRPVGVDAGRYRLAVQYSRRRHPTLPGGAGVRAGVARWQRGAVSRREQIAGCSRRGGAATIAGGASAADGVRAMCAVFGGALRSRTTAAVDGSGFHFAGHGAGGHGEYRRVPDARWGAFGGGAGTGRPTRPPGHFARTADEGGEERRRAGGYARRSYSRWRGVVSLSVLVGATSGPTRHRRPPGQGRRPDRILHRGAPGGVPRGRPHFRHHRVRYHCGQRAERRHHPLLRRGGHLSAHSGGRGVAAGFGRAVRGRHHRCDPHDVSTRQRRRHHRTGCFCARVLYRVLRGHIALDTAVFPEGTAGCMLDSFARRELWRAGLDYRHGTGHGVGAALNVHEGPQSISMRVSVPAVGLQPGMVVSNEPGYYQDGAFGIRLENLLVVREVSTPARFGDRRYLGFERLTLVPFDKQLMDLHMLSASEMDWVDAYHAQVLATVGSYLAEREEGEVLRWLERACAPLARPPRASGSPVRNGQEGRGGGIAERWLGAAIVALVLGGLTWASAALWTPPVRAAEVVVPTPNPSITAPDTVDASGQQPDRPRRLSLLTEEPRITHRCYLDVAIADQPAGRIVIGVYADEAPQSAQCFLSMCERGYAGTDVYRILSGFTVQVGPPPTTSSSSASRCAPDEPRLRHDRLGAVSLVRDAQQRSNGRFFITTRDDSGYLDGKYTVFGRVLEGMEVVRRVEQVGSRGPSNAPKKPVHIVAAGVLPP
eukprot:ctg_325.g82